MCVMNKKIIQIAIAEAFNCMRKNEGGPFGAVILKDGIIISRAHNTVIKTNDPTAHAEINAIRKAGKKLKRFNLSDCQIYSSCEPCPMCFAAIKWAKIKTVFYGSTRKEAADAGFDDKLIYDLIKGRTVITAHICKQLLLPANKQLFDEWERKQDRVQY